MLNERFLQRLRAARHVVVFTGAGMSAESGIPTFRDRFEGLWAKYDPEEVATPDTFRANPQLVWDWLCIWLMPCGGRAQTPAMMQ